MVPHESDDEDRREGTSPSSESEESIPVHRPPDIQGSALEPRGGDVPALRETSELSSEEIIAIVAALIPGLGQLMLGQTVKGLVLIGLALITCSGMGLISVASVIDAYLVARAKKRRTVGEWEFFPDFKETFDL